ncbi:MAG: excinuclease ABC subunit UvrA [Legionellales bacterium]|nr:excinuclease ABC subunit UvrA [Legionellales bacterium]
MSNINIKGAKTHNLKNIDLTIPRDKLVVITGLSGSGKSSLAFDTLYAEGQRKYVESLSAYARQFLSVMEKPDVDHIEGLSPAISIEQKATSHNPRSTVGTITEIHDYLRLLFARVGVPHCPNHPKIKLQAQSISQIVKQLKKLKSGTKIMLLAPVVQNQKGEHIDLLNKLRSQGYIRAIIDSKIYELDSPPKLKKNIKHTIEVIVDRVKIKPGIESRLSESLEHIINFTDGIIHVREIDENTHWIFSTKYSCIECGFSAPKLEPRLFSFNNPLGACSKCNGLGVDQYFDMNKIIHDPSLTIAQGAIKGWDSRKFFYFSMLKSLAVHYNFDINIPYAKLSKKIKNIILYGSGSQEISFHYANSQGTVYQKKHPFEGVIPNMERRLHDTDSNIVREELSKYLSIKDCNECHGDRLSTTSRNVFINKTSLPQIANLSISDATNFFSNLNLKGQQQKIAEKITKEIQDRLSFLMNVGLNYLTLSRSADTLSGGEAQRIRLASQIGSGLVGVMYILDEPSIGLHQRDNDRLLSTLTRLKELGNTVIVVEHDEDAILMADHVIDIGPGAGIHGGEIVASGTPTQIKNSPKSLTGKYLSGKRKIHSSDAPHTIDHSKIIKLENVDKNNLKNVSVEIPLGLLTCITGVSGSGKSSLINDTLYPLIRNKLFRNDTQLPDEVHATIENTDLLTNVINITQSPIGRTPRSNPATYTGLFIHIRELFAGTTEARSRGYKPGRFSFNVKGGRCESCQGDGLIKVEMHFLADVYVHCDQCKGKRYNNETLEIYYKGKNIHQVLEMNVEEARVFFDAIPSIANKLQTLIDVGLSYICLGQSATTLSGGEAQRIKLSKELSRRSTGNTLYILDEPTTGLHFHDIEQLLTVLMKLRNKGNTILVIEHNLDIIKCADWIIDLGPEGGDNGGRIIATGTPKEVMKNKKSYTGVYLKKHLDRIQSL